MFGIHSLEYDQLESFFYLFGALEHGSHWLSWDHVTELANEISVPTVPVLTIGTVSFFPFAINIIIYCKGLFFLLQFDDMAQVEREIATAMKQHSKCGKMGILNLLQLLSS